MDTLFIAQYSSMKRSYRNDNFVSINFVLHDKTEDDEQVLVSTGSRVAFHHPN
eukprot:m.195574 g.195574  ORF g.195574 m.195574 type:complete len:53 (+) comp18679_c0_seq3:1494-1652(+)